MDLGLLTVVVAVIFAALLALGRRDIAKGAGTDVANGAMVLVLATVVGVALVLMVGAQA